MAVNPKVVVKGGTSKTNPYKVHYDLILSERREYHEYLKNSVLWSPRYTPRHFLLGFLFPAVLVAGLMCYIRYIAIPKRMVYLK
jgi:hypothetical protein